MRFLNKLGNGVRNISHRFLGFLENWTAPLTLMVLAAVLVLSIWFWDSWSGKEESVGMALRNLVLVIAAIAALPLAIWRSKVAQHGLLNERYQKGAEMLGSEVLSVRLGGIYALARLAREYAGDYHTQIMSLLCAFVRHPLVIEEEAQNPKLRDDVQAIMTAIGERSEAQSKVEKKEGYRIGLIGANLAGATLHAADLQEAELTGVNLQYANLIGVVLLKADLRWANLAGSCLAEANLAEARLRVAHLNNASLCGCKGLTQEQLDQALAHKDHTPDLTGAVDATTGKPLVWRAWENGETE